MKNTEESSTRSCEGLPHTHTHTHTHTHMCSSRHVCISDTLCTLMYVPKHSLNLQTTYPNRWTLLCSYIINVNSNIIRRLENLRKFLVS